MDVPEPEQEAEELPPRKREWALAPKRGFVSKHQRTESWKPAEKKEHREYHTPAAWVMKELHSELGESETSAYKTRQKWATEQENYAKERNAEIARHIDLWGLAPEQGVALFKAGVGQLLASRQLPHWSDPAWKGRLAFLDQMDEADADPLNLLSKGVHPSRILHAYHRLVEDEFRTATGQLRRFLDYPAEERKEIDRKEREHGAPTKEEKRDEIRQNMGMHAAFIRLAIPNNAYGNPLRQSIDQTFRFNPDLAEQRSLYQSLTEMHERASQVERELRIWRYKERYAFTRLDKILHLFRGYMAAAGELDIDPHNDWRYKLRGGYHSQGDDFPTDEESD